MSRFVCISLVEYFAVRFLNFIIKYSEIKQIKERNYLVLCVVIMGGFVDMTN